MQRGAGGGLKGIKSKSETKKNVFSFFPIKKKSNKTKTRREIKFFNTLINKL